MVVCAHRMVSGGRRRAGVLHFKKAREKIMTRKACHYFLLSGRFRREITFLKRMVFIRIIHFTYYMLLFIINSNIYY